MLRFVRKMLMIKEKRYAGGSLFRAVFLLLRRQMLSVSSFQPLNEPWWLTRRVLLFGLILLLTSTLSCAGRADLVAGPGQQALDCPTDADQRLLITVSNEGKRPAKATTTVLQYEDRPPVHVPTRPIGPGQSETLTVQLPDECLWSACWFEVKVDYKDEVAEKDETNNQIQGQCIRVGRRQVTTP